MNDCSPQFERVATEAAEQKDFAAFKRVFLSQFSVLADRAGRYISRLCNRDRAMVLENALTLAWTLREEINPMMISVLRYWDECLQGAIRMQRTWFVRAFDGWQRVTSEDICSVFGLPAFVVEDV